MSKQISKKIKIKKVLEYMGANHLMTLGTSLKDKPWLATVLYAFDGNLRIFFYSNENTRHCVNISKNPNVSVVINHTWRYPDGKEKAIQLAGRASKVAKKDYVRWYDIYKSRFKRADEFKSDHILYVIEPTEVWYLDEKLFGHFNRVKVI